MVTYIQVYFFDVENPNEIVNGAKPLVKEKGPYVYKQYRKKTIKSIDENEDTISYTQREIFEFDAEASGNFSDEDYVTILNTPMNSILQIAEKYGHQIIKLLANCLNDIFNQMGTVFVKVRVKDILFDGVQFCVPHSSLCALQQTLVCNVAAKKKNVDKLQNNSLQFSFFNYKARSDDGLYTVKRGIQNIQTLGHIVKLNNSTRTNFWQRLGPNSVCDKVEGTDSTLYPPEISRDSVFKIYSTDICRDNIDGIEPHEDLHRTYLIVEPETGTPLEGMKRIQINAVLRPVGNINLMKHLPRVVLPLLWIEE
ncbi:sensory neuron membrane protein 2-like, partial [Asbolus verrucosus]